MGTFRTTIMIENVERRGQMRTVEDALVDTGSEYTWPDRFSPDWRVPQPD